MPGGSWNQPWMLANVDGSRSVCVPTVTWSLALPPPRVGGSTAVVDPRSRSDWQVDARYATSTSVTGAWPAGSSTEPWNAQPPSGSRAPWYSTVVTSRRDRSGAYLTTSGPVRVGLLACSGTTTATAPSAAAANTRIMATPPRDDE